MIMLKKSLIYLSCFALLACFASCNKTEDGVYNPSKKIHKIYEVNENGEATLSQDWHWDGDMLTSIDNYYALLTLTDHFTYDDQSRLTRIDNGSSHSEFFYDGKELRTVIVFEFDAAQHAVEPEVLSRRLILERAVIVGDGFLVFFLPDPAQSPELVDAGDIGIEVDGLGAIALRPDEVVEVILGHAPVVPGLINIRFGRDGSVEMLDGEHIVLIIQSTSATHDQPVHIELS